MLLKNLVGQYLIRNVQKVLFSSESTTTNKMSITHVLFDFDGTLVNTIDCMADIFEKIIVENGKQMTTEIKDYIPNITSFRSLLEFINEKTGLTLTYDEFKVDFLNKILDSNLQLMPGVEKLVEHLSKNEIPIAVATGNSKPFYDRISSKFGDFFPKHFNHYVCAFDDPDVANMKPSPDVYLVAAKRFPSPPKTMDNVLIFEDSMTGLKGALASGGKTIFVCQNLSQIKNEHEEILKNCSMQLNTLEDFKPESVGLPPY